MNDLARRFGLHPKAFLGLVVLGVGLLLWGLAFTGGLTTLFPSSTRTVTARFASAEDIVANDPVRVDGVQVGSVSDVALDRTRGDAVVTMKLDTDQPIYRDASASILWRTALGAVDAIALDPGTRSAGPLGDSTIQESRDTNQVELDQITRSFAGRAQPGTRTMLQQLGPALEDHRALGTDLSIAAIIADPAAAGVGALRGQEPDTDLRNLVRDAGAAARALSVGTQASETQRFVESAATTLAATGANPAALRDGLAAFGRVYTDGDRTVFRQYNDLLSRADPLVARLNRSVGQIAPAVARLRPAVTHAHTLLASAGPLLHELDPTVRSLASTAVTGVPVINQLKPGLVNLATKDLPGIAERYPEEGGRAVYQMLMSPVLTFGALSGFFNPDGQIAYLTAGLEEPQAQQALPCDIDFSGTDLLACKSLSDSIELLFSGGTSLLQSLVGKPGGQAIYGPLLAGARRLEAQLATTKSDLAARQPGAVKKLFKPLALGGSR